MSFWCDKITRNVGSTVECQFSTELGIISILIVALTYYLSFFL